MRDFSEFKAGVEQLEENRARITIIITPERLEEGLAHSYDVNKKKINIPGFRKGEIPRKILEAQFGKGFLYEEAINFILPDAYEKAADESGLEIVSRAEFDSPFIDPALGAVITADVWTKPSGIITDYKGLEYEPITAVIADGDVDTVIEREREKNARFVPVEDRPVQMGDITRIDYEGSVDGIPFEGGKADDQELIIGQGRFIPGFEEQLVGMNAGETRNINVTFPEEYHAEELKGKPAVFSVTINSIHYKELPEIDDEFACSVSDFETLDEYKNDIRAKLEKDKEDEVRNDAETKLASLLAERVVANIPDAMVESEINQMVNGFARNMQSRGIPMEQYLKYVGGTIEELRESYRETALRNIRVRLALEHIAEIEGITVSDEEINKEIDEMAARYEFDAEKMRGLMSQRELKSLGLDCRVQKALKLVMDNAVKKAAV